jgi:hypothetical protein
MGDRSEQLYIGVSTGAFRANVNFQKSRWAQRDETTFYVNVAACSKRWLGIERKPADKVPP